MTKETSIPIAFICDENYVMPTGVAITSLIANKNPETIYDVHIYGNSITQKSKEKLQSMKQIDVQITVHDISNKINTSSILDPEYVSNATYLKFELPSLLTQYNKALYIDSDTIITSDLTNLYNTDIDDVYAAVVEDIYAVLQKDANTNYNVNKFFNAGVMLFNLKMLREENMPTYLKKVQKEIQHYNTYMDNGVFVTVFNNNVKYLSPIYNYMNPCCDFNNEDFYNFYHDDKFKNISSPLLPAKELTIIHYTAEKPWNTACCFYWDEWIKYFKQSPFKKQKLRAKRFKFFRRERGKHLTLITILGIKFRIIK